MYLPLNFVPMLIPKSSFNSVSEKLSLHLSRYERNTQRYSGKSLIRIKWWKSMRLKGRDRKTMGGDTEDINLRSFLIKGAPLGNGGNLGPFRSRNEEKLISKPICLLLSHTRLLKV